MKPNPHRQRDKKIIATVLLLIELRLLAQRKVTLEEPIQRGWKRHFVMTPSARRREDTTTLSAILEVINVVRYHWRRSFAPSKRRCSRRIEHEHALRSINCGHQQELSKLPRGWERYFQLERRWEHRQWYWHWVFCHPHLFHLRTERHWITELPLLDPSLESRRAELESFLETRHGWARFDRIKGRSLRRWLDDDPRLRQNKFLSQKRIRAARMGDHEAERRAVAAAFRSASSPRTVILTAAIHFLGPKLRQRSSRLLTGGAGCVSLWADQIQQGAWSKGHGV